MNAIKVLLLKGGLEVIAEVESLRASALVGISDGSQPVTGYRLNKPYRILPVPIPMQKQTPQGVAIDINITPQIVPLLAATIQNAIEISVDDVIGSPLDISKQFESAYVQRTTGLALA